MAGGRGHRSLTDAQAAEVARRYMAGETIDELAAAFRCSNHPIRRAIEEAGVPFRRRSWRPIEVDVDELRRLYLDEGHSLEEVAEQVGVSLMTVKRRLIAAGVEMRSRSEAARVHYWGPEGSLHHPNGRTG